LFHSFRDEKEKNLFRFFDYSGIFLLIAGTYTPITLVFMRGPWGWSIFGVAWGMAIIGIALRILFPKNIELLLAVFYILMGWVFIIAIKPLFALVPSNVLLWLFIGGLSYMSGFIFLSWKKLPYHHAIWHLFVLGGSTCHFFGLLFGIN
jgi:hemolysin III